jgi:hypothetical protein
VIEFTKDSQYNQHVVIKVGNTNFASYEEAKANAVTFVDNKREKDGIWVSKNDLMLYYPWHSIAGIRCFGEEVKIDKR